MRMPSDADLTLPSIIASLAGRYAAHELVLTIVFHPDTSRIGHRAVLPQRADNNPLVLGRFGPDFCGPDGECMQPLADPHVSRSALKFVVRGKRLSISRFEASSRCRLGSTELYDSVELAWDQLRHGVPLMLGHSVVLLLRLGHARAPAGSGTACDQLLRGSSTCMAGIREQVARAAASDLDVLIRGATGTGKELVATAIHSTGRRAAAPLVCVNMAAIPAELAAAALFGSTRGAFTGADRTVRGYFEQAQGGTLFLDEIGDASAEIQPQLLRALQQREIQAVGGAIRRVDVRVISATDAALDGENCDFKAALRHRLGACEIQLPPLREHPEDIGELLLYFLHRSAAESGRTDLLPHAQSHATEIAAWAVLFFNFLCYPWPGNVRELSNFAQQVVLASEEIPILNENLQAALALVSVTTSAGGVRPPLRKMQDISDEEFHRAMVSSDFEPLRVARHLGVSRAAVYRRIELSSRYRLASDISSDELQCAFTQHRGDSAAVARHLGVSINSLRSQLRKLHAIMD